MIEAYECDWDEEGNLLIGNTVEPACDECYYMRNGDCVLDYPCMED